MNISGVFMKNQSLTILFQQTIVLTVVIFVSAKWEIYSLLIKFIEQKILIFTSKNCLTRIEFAWDNIYNTTILTKNWEPLLNQHFLERSAN